MKNRMAFVNKDKVQTFLFQETLQLFGMREQARYMFNEEFIEHTS